MESEVLLAFQEDSTIIGKVTMFCEHGFEVMIFSDHRSTTTDQIISKCIKEAKSLILTQDKSKVNAALSLINSALSISPKQELALELKARSLLFLKRYREVADMLQDYIPSYKLINCDDDSSSCISSCDFSKERAKLLKSNEEKIDESGGYFRCFTIIDLKRKLMDKLSKRCKSEGHWRYLILGQACYHLGLIEDAMLLLQTARRIFTDTSRQECTSFSDDKFTVFSDNPSESESASTLLSHIKFLLRRRSAALSALDSGLPSESIRHFTKIVDGRHCTPSSFASGCFIGRARAYRVSGRAVEAIADCNRALALDPSSICALRVRADLMDSVNALLESLRDLEHLKLLYDSILRDRKLPGPAWKPHNSIRYREIPGSLRALTTKIQELRKRIAKGEGCNVDYYKLIGVRRGCNRFELERAHLILSIKHKPDKGLSFVERVEFVDEYRDIYTVKDQARTSNLTLYRMLSKGYSSIMLVIMEEEAAERQRAKEQLQTIVVSDTGLALEKAVGPLYQGTSCRNMISCIGFNRESIAC